MKDEHFGIFPRLLAVENFTRIRERGLRKKHGHEQAGQHLLDIDHLEFYDNAC